MKRLLPALIVVLAAIIGAVRGARMSSVPGDFLRYHRAGRLVATGRADLLYDAEFLASRAVYAEERTAADKMPEKEFKYAPAFAVLMAPLGALSARTANVLWCAWNAALIAALFLVAWSWCSGGLSAWWMLVPVALLARTVIDNFNNGQINPTAIVPATVGLWLVTRGRDRAGGALVGLGAVVKFMPAVLALWLAWKRRWAALAACVGAVVLVGVVLPALVLGPSRSLELTRQWRDARAHVYTSAAPQELPGYSVKSYVYRVFGTTPYVTEDEDGRERRVVVGADALSPEALRATTIALDVLLVLLALWFARGPLRGAGDPRGPPDAALILCALPLVSPEARYPHFLYLALPITALVYALVRRRDSSWRRRVAFTLAVVGAFCVNATSEKLVGHDTGLAAEIWCVPGWGALAVGCALALAPVSDRSRRSPSSPSA